MGSRGELGRAVVVCVLLLAPPALAQDAELQQGLHYYAVENLATRQVEQRGIAGSSGVAFKNLLLRPRTRYRLWILQAASLEVGSLSLTTGDPGQRQKAPEIPLTPTSSPDSDGDGLHDLGELILGTDPRNPDSDGDGVKDGPEVQQGSDPLDGVPARTGIIASVDTPGSAVDVTGRDDMLVVADSSAGVSVFNVFNRLTPRAIARVDTPGTALRVTCSGARIAVADGPGGLVLIDASDPPRARIAHQVSSFLLGGTGQAVAVVDRVAFVGTSTGEVVSVDIASGAVLERVQVGDAVRDLAVEKDTLYVLTHTKLHLIPLLEPGPLKVVSAIDSPTDSGTHSRVFVGNDVAYPVRLNGYNTIDVRDNRAPRLIAEGRTIQTGWNQLVPDGSGLGVGAIGIGGVAVYDVSDPTQTDVPVAGFSTPGVARSATVYNGLAYVADQGRGLQVVNYRAPDTAGIAPTISLTTSFGFTSIEEGQLARASAVTSDDVAVRNVEWYLDGAKVSTDGSFPFELHFSAPRLAQQPSFVLRARVSDTGGNMTWSDPLTITLTSDTTGPTVRRVVPLDGSTISSTATVAAFVSEPIDPATLTSTTFVLTEAGPDQTHGTADDALVSGGTRTFQAQLQGAFLTLSQNLGSGRYRARLTTGVQDVKGNPLTAERSWTFRVIDVTQDRDADGVPDDLEPVLGLDPDDPDSDNDGTPDGQEDADRDGLVNSAEVIFRRDPLNPDSDGDGVADGEEDLDSDGLTDGQELVLTTDPFEWDTDGDRFGDGEEVTHQSDPKDAQSLPLRAALGTASAANTQGTLNHALSTTSVKSTAAPDATRGRAEGPAITVENQGGN